MSALVALVLALAAAPAAAQDTDGANGTETQPAEGAPPAEAPPAEGAPAPDSPAATDESQEDEEEQSETAPPAETAPAPVAQDAPATTPSESEQTTAPAPTTTATETRAQAQHEESESEREASHTNSQLLQAGIGGAAAPSFRLTGVLTSDVGQGSFIMNEYARNAYVDWNLTLLPAFTFDGNTFQAQATIYQELTDSDGDTENQRVLLSDTQLIYNRMVFTIPEADINVFANGRVILPTSLASQYDGLYFGAQAQVGFMRTFGPVTLFYRSAFRKNFHEYTSPTVDLSDYDEQVFLARSNGRERIDALTYSPGGNNVSYSFTNRLQVMVTPFDELTITGEYIVSNGFTYEDYALDALSGAGAKAGRGQRDAYTTYLDFTYTMNSNIYLSTGISTSGSPRGADGRHFVFPFLDTESEANNLTTFYVSLTATGTLDDLQIGEE